MNGPATGARLSGIDTTRGVAIAFVVAIHAAGQVESEAYRDHVVSGLARLGVPLFLVISGFLTALRETPRERFQDYLRKFLVLHVLYGLGYAVLFLVTRGFPTDFGLKWLVLRFGEASWPGQYYFLILIQLFAVAGWLVRPHLWQRGVALALCASLVPLGLLFSYALATRSTLPLGPLRSLLQSKICLGYWLYYFALGAWIGGRFRRGVSWQPAQGTVALLLVSSAAIALFGFTFLGDDAESVLTSYLRVRIYLATTLVALALPSLAGLDPLPWLRRLGRDSFGIFVLNPLLLELTFAVVGRPRRVELSLGCVAVVLAAGLPIARQLRLRAPWAYA